MDLVDEQHVARLQVREYCREVARTFQNRARCLSQIHPDLVGDNVSQRRLTQPRRPEDQRMVQRLAAIACRGDEDPHLALDADLTDEFVVVQRARAHGSIEDGVVVAACSGQ